MLVTELPILQVIPVEEQAEAAEHVQDTRLRDAVATQRVGVGLVFEADLATSEHSSHWVLQGVAWLNIDQ